MVNLGVRLVKQDGTPWSDWFTEEAVVRPANSSITRLSGKSMRRLFYFGTDPFYNVLAVSRTKGGMTSLLS